MKPEIKDALWLIFTPIVVTTVGVAVLYAIGIGIPERMLPWVFVGSLGVGYTLEWIWT